MRILGTFLRYGVYVLLVVVLALGSAVAAVISLSESARNSVAGLVSGLVSSPGQEVRISGLDGIFSGQLRIREVAVSDATGPWVVLRGVAVDWSPSALLGFTFRADRLRVDRIEMARPPLPSTEPASTGGGLSLPVAVDIAAIDLPDIALGQSLAGEIARLAATGNVAIAGNPVGGRAKLSASRTDGRTGSLDLDATYAPGDNRIELKARALEPQGGILAGLLKLPGAPAVEIVADGSGPLSDWTGRATMSVAGQPATRLTARHQAIEGGNRFELSGAGAFAPLLPGLLAPLAAGDTRFELSAARMESGAWRIDRSSLNSQAFSATASGTYDPAGQNDVSVEGNAVGAPVALAFGSDAARADVMLRSFSARLQGPADGAALQAQAELAQAGTADHRVEDLAVTLRSADLDVTTQTGRVEWTAEAAAAGSVNEYLASLLAGRIKASGALEIGSSALGFDATKLSSDAASLDLNGSYGRSDGKLDANVSARVLSAVLPISARAVLDRDVALSAKVTRDTAGSISAENLSVQSGSLAVMGSAAYGDVLSADLAGTLSDVSRLSPQARGAVGFSLAARGTPARPDVAVTVTSDRMEVAGQAIETLRMEAQLLADPAAPAGRLQLSGKVGGQPLTGSGTLAALPQGGGSVRDLAISLGANKLDGALTLDVDMRPTGTISFSLPDLKPLAALALTDAAGAASGTARFDVAGGRANLALDATVHDFRGVGVEADQIRLNAGIDDYLGTPRITGGGSVGRVIASGTELRDIKATLGQDGPWTSFDLALTANAVPVTAKGRAQYAGGNAAIELGSATATLPQLAARLAAPTTVRVAGSSVRLDGLSIAAAGGTVTATGSAGAAALDLDVRLAALPASVANAFVPGLDATGTLSGSARITGSPSAPRVTYDARLAGAQAAQTRSAGFGAIDIASTGTYEGDVLRFQARIGEGSGIGATAQGSVNVGTRTASIDASGRMPFAFLARRLAAQGVALDGAADVSITVRGNLLAPTLGGTIRASGARLVHAPSGLAVNDLAADIALEGGVARINRLAGALSTGGTLAGTGTVQVMTDGFPADLSLSLQNGRYTDGRVVTASLDGALTIKGPLTGEPVIGGTVNLGRTVITIPERLPTSLNTLDVRHRNAPQAVREQQAAIRPAEAASGGSGLTLDVQVNAPQQIFVQGRGLDVELGGSLRLTGPASAAQAVGTFDMRRGRLSILGQRLEFTRGSIGFSGSLVPYLNLAATSTVNSSSVTVLVTGPANNPNFAFEASPALPEDEILARLVFGRAMGSLSAVQIAQLAAAAGQLAGVGGSTSLLESLRSQIGVDDLDVRTDEKTGDTSVSVGKYLNDRTYLSIEKGSQPGSGKARIDLNVGRGVKLRGEAADDGKTRGGIFYEREY